MPTCSKCHPVYDLGRICPHQGPGRDVWQQGWDTGYVEGINAAHLGFAEPPPERRILRDLITELRADGVGHAEDNFMLGQCKSCEERWPCVLVQHADMAVRAETRLREVGGDE